MLINDVDQYSRIDMFVAVDDKIAEPDHIAIVLFICQDTEFNATSDGIAAGGSRGSPSDGDQPLASINDDLYQDLQVSLDSPPGLPVVVQLDDIDGAERAQLMQCSIESLELLGNNTVHHTCNYKAKDGKGTQTGLPALQDESHRSPQRRVVAKFGRDDVEMHLRQCRRSGRSTNLVPPDSP